MFYRIIECLELTPKDEQEIQKLPNSLVPQHPERLKQYMASRKALMDLLHEQGHPANLEKLFVEKHLNLKDFPQWLVSLTHTKHYGASVIAPRESYRSVGIDLEEATRKVPAEAQKFFHHPQDLLEEEQTLLDLWVIKEACFKALDPLRVDYKIQGPLVLSDIWIKQGTFGHKNWAWPLGSYRMELLTPRENLPSQLLALAWVT